jgi:hypothetical protein
MAMAVDLCCRLAYLALVMVATRHHQIIDRGAWNETSEEASPLVRRLVLVVWDCHTGAATDGCVDLCVL